MSCKQARFYEFGPFRIDVSDRLLLRDGNTVPMTPKAFDTLLALVENPGRVVEKDEFLRPLFAMRPKFDMHPSAFMFSASLADQVVRRCGRFFQTNGVEYFAWPLAAVFSKRMVHIDAPLVILGRTFKSWGSTIVLSNPGSEQIAKMIADVNHDRSWIPLTNFTGTSLIAEGLLLGKKLFPEELQPYPFSSRTIAPDDYRATLNVTAP